jgi:hypothetical protein
MVMSLSEMQRPSNIGLVVTAADASSRILWKNLVAEVSSGSFRQKLVSEVSNS